MAQRHKTGLDDMPQAGEAGPGREALELDQFVGYNLRRAYSIVEQDFRRVLGEDGFAPRVFSTLSLVVQFPNVTQSDLARRLGIERSGLVAIVDGLEGKGYLNRTTVPGDRRVQALVATEAGKAAHKAARAAIVRHEDELFSHMTREERETLLSLLHKLRQREA